MTVILDEIFDSVDILDWGLVIMIDNPDRYTFIGRLESCLIKSAEFTLTVQNCPIITWTEDHYYRIMHDEFSPMSRKKATTLINSEHWNGYFKLLLNTTQIGVFKTGAQECRKYGHEFRLRVRIELMDGDRLLICNRLGEAVNCLHTQPNVTLKWYWVNQHHIKTSLDTLLTTEQHEAELSAWIGPEVN